MVKWTKSTLHTLNIALFEQDETNHFRDIKNINDILEQFFVHFTTTCNTYYC